MSLTDPLSSYFEFEKARRAKYDVPKKEDAVKYVAAIIGSKVPVAMNEEQTAAIDALAQGVVEALSNLEVEVYKDSTLQDYASGGSTFTVHLDRIQYRVAIRGSPNYYSGPQPPKEKTATFLDAISEIDNVVSKKQDARGETEKPAS